MGFWGQATGCDNRSVLITQSPSRGLGQDKADLPIRPIAPSIVSNLHNLDPESVEHFPSVEV